MRLLPITITLFCLLFSATLFSQDRNCDPVVLKGIELPCMLDEMPEDIVAFKYANGSWIQIPVQIDERVLLDIAAPYDQQQLQQMPTCLRDSNRDTTWNVLFYADVDTHTGADTLAIFDEDDELALMKKDAGDKSNATSYPTGTVEGSVCEIAITEPLNNDAILGYIYLFLQNGSLDQSAGVDYITYNFSYDPDSMNVYLDTYEECVNDPNANLENSIISTNNYEIGFSQRWTEEILKIKAGSATGIDILDRHQYFINAGVCNSTEDRFSSQQGAHIAAIDGPIRVIRSVIGTSSGPFTHLDIIATECQVKHDMFFRLHPANGFNDVIDMNDYALNKLTYYSEQNPSGVSVNGVDENLDLTDPDEWQLYEGAPGSLIISWDYATDMIVGTSAEYSNGTGTADADVRAYYDDGGAGASHDCTGDGLAYGSSGFVLRTKECTDYRNSNSIYPECTDNPFFFNIFRVHYYQAPGITTTQAAEYGEYAKNPLGNIVMDGIGVGVAQCPSDELFMDETLTGNATYYAVNTITTDEDVIIASGANITFVAGQSITLTDGFIATNGSTFTARIGSCPPAANTQNAQQRSANILSNQAIEIYPNPVSQQVNLVYRLTQSSDITIRLYDRSGKEITVLEKNIQQKAGKYQSQFDIGHLASGIYFVVLQTDQEIISRKISVLK